MINSLLNSGMFDAIKSIFAFLVALGVLITIHEFGHFWVARRCGVKVLRFSIGFGKVLWRKVDRHGTEFVLSVLPLGGYVKMLDGRADAIPEDEKHLAFNHKSVGQRMAIVAAGPLTNLLFALLIYWALFIYGIPGLIPVVDSVKPGSFAEQSGLQSGMRIDAVNGLTTEDLATLELTFIDQQSKPVLNLDVTHVDDMRKDKVALNISGWRFAPEKEGALTSLGIIPALPKISLTLKDIIKNSIAEQAGLKANDRVIKANGKTLNDGLELSGIINNSGNKQLLFEVERDGSLLEIQLIPKLVQSGDKTVGQIGVLMAAMPLDEKYWINMQLNPIRALGRATEKTWLVTTTMVGEIKNLLIGNRSLKALAGPVTIAQSAGASANSGLTYYVSFIALISINLAIINLFPLPVLDGGHLLFLLIEKIMGKPVSEKVLEYSYRLGIFCLMLLMGLTLFNDFSRL